jgi:NAD(P)-dependent dehydrogenase (short-subunit alcohol dehydrogenase family)
VPLTNSCPWSSVWITGASTGIGRELALRLAAMGAVVAVSARSVDKLNELAALSPNIKAYPLDVEDESAVKDTAERIGRDLGPIDLAVLNAGIWRMMSVSDFSAQRAKQSMGVNYFGVINALEPVMKAMAARGQGQIGIVSSVAGYRGVMRGAAYAPTKAALISLVESLNPHALRHGVRLTIICPGFIETPMTAPNTFPMPFIIPVDEAVTKIVNGLRKKKYEIVFPWKMALLMKTLRILPNRLFFALVTHAGDRAQTLDTGVIDSGDGKA